MMMLIMSIIMSLLVIPGALAAEEPATTPKAPTIQDTLSAGAPSLEPIAGYIFGVAVPAGHYAFAKRVSSLFPRPWEENLTGAERERAIWEALILHYESFRRNVTVSDEELTTRIDSVLQSQQQPFTKTGDPAAYERWVKETFGEGIEQFENQMRYLCQIDKLKDDVRESLAVTVTEEEMQDEALKKWIEDLKTSAQLKILPLPD